VTIEEKLLKLNLYTCFMPGYMQSVMVDDSKDVLGQCFQVCQ